MSSKFRAAGRWLAPSAVAASGGAVIAGVREGIAMGEPLGAIAAAGFFALVALPVLFVLSVMVRALWTAWRPHELALIEPDGSAPRLAGWLGVIVIGALLLAWAMFQGTWLLAGINAFKPLSLAFLEPVLAVAVTLVVVAAARPLARLVTALARKLPARALTPRRIVGGLAVALAVIGYLVWRLAVKRRLGPVDVSWLDLPVLALAVTGVLHAVWLRAPGARRAGGAVLGGLAVATIATALLCWQLRPSLTLAIWGERPVAGLAIDQLFDLDAIRAGVSLAEFKPAVRAGSPHPDIVLVTIDTVRADHTPPYGGSAEMPLLRELATKGAVFEWAFSPSNVTRRSIPSMIIGLAPNRVHGRVVGWALRVDPRHVLVAERLQAGGYDTAGFMCCGGFWGEDFHTGLQRGLAHLEIEPNGLALARKARAWLDERAKHPTGKPLFLWMHILEPHNWQLASGEPHTDDERRKFYDRSLAASDAMLVELLGAFAGRKPEDAPIVLVTADHGEGLGDHGQPNHSTDLYNSQTHVPLVIAGPGIKPGRIAETVSLTDLTPTLLELAGFEPPRGAAMDGHSIADLAQGRRTGDPDGGTAFAAMIKDRSNPGGITAITQGRWKLIDNNGALELYDTRVDPGEHANLVSQKSGIVDTLRRRLKELVAAGDRSPF